MKILQKIKSLFNCSVIPPEHIFNGIGIEYITPIKNPGISLMKFDIIL